MSNDGDYVFASIRVHSRLTLVRVIRVFRGPRVVRYADRSFLNCSVNSVSAGSVPSVAKIRISATTIMLTMNAPLMRQCAHRP